MRNYIALTAALWLALITPNSNAAPFGPGQGLKLRSAPSSGGGGGISFLNGLNDSTQDFATGTSGTDFAISSASGIHTFNIPTASGSARGLLSSSDWTTFNGKQSTLTLGNLTSPTTGVTVTGGTGAVVGSGAALSIQTASGSQPGLLSSADWTTFNGKQASGSYITALTGDVTASGPGSASATISASTVTGKALTGFSSSAGTVTSSDSILTGFNKVVGNIALRAPGYAETDDGNSSTADTIDWSVGSAHKSTLTGNVTYTFTAPSAAGTPLVLRILTGAGSFTVTWPATVKWPSGTAPTITTTASRMDLCSFLYDGTNYYGSCSQNYTP